MSSARNPAVAAGSAPVGSSHSVPRRGLVVTGLVATVASVAVTTAAAALARAVGVDFEIQDGAETIPLSGIAVVTGFFSAVGVVLAAALGRWSARPAERFGWTAVSLTTVSLVPPFAAGADAATAVSLAALHLVAASVMVPALWRCLRHRAG